MVDASLALKSGTPVTVEAEEPSTPKPHNYPRKRPERPQHLAYQYNPRIHSCSKAEVHEWLRSGVDSLVIVTHGNIKATLMGLLPFVRPSRPVVLFSAAQAVRGVTLVGVMSRWVSDSLELPQPLVECQKLLLDHNLVTKLELFETWTRHYQVLPNRTHPTMQTHGASGFILWGYTVESHFTKRLAGEALAEDAAADDVLMSAGSQASSVRQRSEPAEAERAAKRSRGADNGAGDA